MRTSDRLPRAPDPRRALPAAPRAPCSAGLLPFAAPALPADLNAGYPAAYVRKPSAGDATPVDHIVRAAAAGVSGRGAAGAAGPSGGQGSAAAGAAREAGGPVDWASVDVVTFRNNLNKILLTPFAPGAAWALDACAGSPAGATVFLDIVHTPDSGPRNPNADRFEYFGYRFESLCCPAPPPAASASDAGAAGGGGGGEERHGAVDATSEFATVVRLRLGGHRLLMAAEIDCQARAGRAGGCEELPPPAPRCCRHFGRPHFGRLSTAPVAAGLLLRLCRLKPWRPAAPAPAARPQNPDAAALPGAASYLELKTSLRPDGPQREAAMLREKGPRWWVQVRARAGGREAERSCRRRRRRRRRLAVAAALLPLPPGGCCCCCYRAPP
jgi:RAT1-interacting protein